MSTQLIKKIRDLWKIMNQRVLQQGSAFVMNKTNRFLFAFEFTKDPDAGLIMTFFASEDEFAALQMVSHYNMDKIHNYDDFIDLKGLRRGIQVSFVPYHELPKGQQSYFTREVLQNRQFMKKYPQILSFNDDKNIESNMTAQERKFLDRCLTLLLNHSNIRFALNVIKKINDVTVIPSIIYNQRTEQFETSEKVTTLKELQITDDLRGFIMDSPEVLQLPELTAFRYQKQIQSLLPETLEIQLSISPMQYFEEFDKGSPKYILKIGSRGLLFYLHLLPKISAADIQESIMAFFASEGFYPKKLVTRGVYAIRLRNILTPICNRLKIPFDIVDLLPTLDSMNHEVLMKEWMEKAEEQFSKPDSKH